MVLGTLTAFALDRFDFPGKQAIRFFVVLPIVLPGIVTGVAMLSFFTMLGWPLSKWTIIIAHATFCITLILNNVVARLGQLPRSLDEASADLGATPGKTFWRVTFPLIRPAILAGAILAFTLSFDEVVVTFFLTGRDKTLPLLIWGRLRQGISPEINAAATRSSSWCRWPACCSPIGCRSRRRWRLVTGRKMETVDNSRQSTVTRRPSGARLLGRPSIELREIYKYFGDVPAVNGVSLDVRQGEFLTLLGPSGCGKTTTLRMIGGFELPSSGEICIEGEPMGDRPPYRRPVNTVFQNYALFPHMTVGQNVELRAGNVGRAESRSGKSGSATRWRWCACRTSRTASRPSSPAGSSSASPWRARWSTAPPCSSWTSRSARSTSSCARRCSSS